MPLTWAWTLDVSVDGDVAGRFVAHGQVAVAVHDNDNDNVEVHVEGPSRRFDAEPAARGFARNTAKLPPAYSG
jgi:hypothetical protein